MYGIHNYKTTVVWIRCGNSNALAGGLNLGCRLDSHDDVVCIIDLYETSLLLKRRSDSEVRGFGGFVGHEMRCGVVRETYCSRLVYVSDLTIRGVTSNEEIPAIEECVPLL